MPCVLCQYFQGGFAACSVQCAVWSVQYVLWTMQCSVCTMNYAVYSIEFAICSSECRLLLHLSQLSYSFTRASPSCWDASREEWGELRGSDVCCREELGGTQEAPAVYAGTSSFPAIIQFFTARSLLPLVSSSTTYLRTMFTRELTNKMSNWGQNAQLGISSCRLGIGDWRLGNRLA